MRALVVDLLRMLLGGLPRLATETTVHPRATESVFPNLRLFEIWMKVFGELLIVR